MVLTCARGNEDISPLYWYPRAAATNHRRLGGWNNRHLFSQVWSLEGWSQGSGRAVLPLVSLGENLPCFFLASGRCWESSVYSCVTPVSASIFTWPLGASLCPLLLSQGHQSLHLGLIIILYDLILTNYENYTSAKSLFLSKFTFWGSKWMSVLGGRYSNCYTLLVIFLCFRFVLVWFGWFVLQSGKHFKQLDLVLHRGVFWQK